MWLRIAEPEPALQIARHSGWRQRTSEEQSAIQMQEGPRHWLHR
jgi:hypothetical protein